MPRAYAIRVGNRNIQIAAGARAGPGTVGYLGPAHDASRTLNVGNAIPGELAGCVWDGNAFRVNGANLAISNWRINAGVDCYGASPVITGCVINGLSDSFYGVLFRAGGSIADSTVTGPGTAGQSGQAVSYDSGTASIVRCDLSGYQDGIGLNDGLISQVWIHGPALTSTFHVDGVQIFGSSNGPTIQHSYIDIRGPGALNSDGVHQNACVYTDLPSPPVVNLTVNNCFLAGGAYFVVYQTNCTGLTFTGNRFGPTGQGEIGEYTIDSGPSGVAVWSGNTHFDGSPANYP